MKRGHREPCVCSVLNRYTYLQLCMYVTCSEISYIRKFSVAVTKYKIYIHINVNVFNLESVNFIIRKLKHFIYVLIYSFEIQCQISNSQYHCGINKINH